MVCKYLIHLNAFQVLLIFIFKHQDNFVNLVTRAVFIFSEGCYDIFMQIPLGYQVFSMVRVWKNNR